jgi:hypothetical protein
LLREDLAALRDILVGAMPGVGVLAVGIIP